MTFKTILSFILITIANVSFSQTLQLKFCGKTTEVVPATDGSGADQRHKGGIRLDFIRVGLNGVSRTNPFYSIGINGSGTSFKNDVQVDGCGSNTNQTLCTGCSTCKTVLSSTNSIIATTLGKMQGNVRVRTSNNDLFLESTHKDRVVCIETQPIDVRAYGGKRLEFNFGYEGTSNGGFNTVNVNAEYRYNNNAYVNTLNQNSNFLRYIDTAIFVIVPVPAVENLDHIIQFNVSPVPADDELFIEYTSQNTFSSTISIIDNNSRILYEEPYDVLNGNGTKRINISTLPQGFYVLQIGDKSGRISHRKFVK